MSDVLSKVLVAATFLSSCALLGCSEVPDAAPQAHPAPTAACTFESLVSSDELTIEEGPLPCSHSDSDVIDCALFKATVSTPADGEGPLDDTSVDDDAMPTNIILAVRAPKGADLCALRWVTFDSGGPGPGYAPFFGEVDHGGYVQGGDGYGDDLIHAYNAAAIEGDSEAGYVTVDISWTCNPKREGCTSGPLAGWTTQGDFGTGWYQNLNGTGFTGAASRARIVYDWVVANNGGNAICAHAHSSGTARLITVLARFGRSANFDTVVFDGGPTGNYMPWICGNFSDGELGPPPAWYSSSEGYHDLINCGYTEGNNSAECSATMCGPQSYDPFLETDSVWTNAATYSWPQTDVSIVLGAADNSNAMHHVPLWLRGWQPTSIPAISAASIRLVQGYCDEGDSQDEVFPAGCARLDPDGFPGIDATDRGYDSRLLGVTHSTARHQGGMQVAFEQGLRSCEPL